MLRDVTTGSRADFVIVTALPEELHAVLAQLSNPKRIDKHEGEHNTFYEAIIQTTRADRARYRIAVTCLPRLGPTQAAIIANAVSKFGAYAALLVGIAGGVKGTVSLGDVIIADQVCDYTLGKITEKEEGGVVSHERANRWKHYPVDPNLLDSANNLEGLWQSKIKPSRPVKGSISKRHIGHIASGGDVISAGKKIGELSKELGGKLIGVEMEGGGFAEGLHASSSQTRFFMIRGVSDLADSKKNSRRTKPWRPYACSSAAAYAIALLEQGPIASREPTRQDDDGKHTDKRNDFADTEIINKLEDVKSILLERTIPKPTLAEQLRQATNENPGLEFTAAIESDGKTTCIIKSKPGSGIKEIGRFRFKLDSEIGRAALEKFNKTIEHGLPLALTASECTLDMDIILPGQSKFITPSSFKITPNPNLRPIPIKLKARRKYSSLCIDLTYLTPTRMGTKTGEMEVSGGQLAATIFLSFERSTDDMFISKSVQVELDLKTVRAELALRTIEFLLSMHPEGRFTIESFERKPLISGTMSGSTFLEEDLLQYASWLKKIVRLGKEFNLDLRYPDKLDYSEATMIDRIINAMENDGVTKGQDNGVLTADIEKTGALAAFDNIEINPNESITIIYSDASIYLMGSKIEIGNLSIQCSGLKFQITRNELVQKLDEISNNDTITLMIDVAISVHIFERFKKKQRHLTRNSV